MASQNLTNEQLMQIFKSSTSIAFPYKSLKLKPDNKLGMDRELSFAREYQPSFNSGQFKSKNEFNTMKARQAGKEYSNCNFNLHRLAKELKSDINREVLSTGLSFEDSPADAIGKDTLLNIIYVAIIDDRDYISVGVLDNNFTDDNNKNVEVNISIGNYIYWIDRAAFNMNKSRKEILEEFIYLCRVYWDKKTDQLKREYFDRKVEMILNSSPGSKLPDNRAVIDAMSGLAEAIKTQGVVSTPSADLFYREKASNTSSEPIKDKQKKAKKIGPRAIDL
jgi:hypothetical protein